MTDELANAVRSLVLRARGKTNSPHSLQTFDTKPGCPFGAIVDERLRDQAAQIAEIKNRINTLIFAVVAATIIQILLRS